MKIAITGATGFLGKYLVRYLFEQKYDVLVLARPEEAAASCFDYNISITETDYSHESLVTALKGTDSVIHLAAQTMQRDTHPLRVSQFFPVNIQITENVLVAAQLAGVKQVVQMSSNNVYSAANQLPFTETQNPIPGSIYGVSKLAAEKLGEYIAYQTGMKVASLRLARLYGYGERDTVVFTKYMKLAVRKEKVEVWGEGKTGIDYLYVRDVVEAIEAAVSRQIPSGFYNVGSGKAVTVKEIAETVCTVCNNTENLVFDLSKTEGGYFIEMDSTKFYHATGWQPKWQLTDAITEMYHLYNG